MGDDPKVGQMEVGQMNRREFLETLPVFAIFFKLVAEGNLGLVQTDTYPDLDYTPEQIELLKWANGENDSTASYVAGGFAASVGTNLLDLMPFNYASGAGMMALASYRIARLKYVAAVLEQNHLEQESDVIKHLADHEENELIINLPVIAILAFAAETANYLRVNPMAIIEEERKQEMKKIEYRGEALTEKIHKQLIYGELITEETTLEELEIQTQILRDEYLRSMAVNSGIGSGIAAGATTYISADFIFAQNHKYYITLYAISRNQKLLEAAKEMNIDNISGLKEVIEVIEIAAMKEAENLFEGYWGLLSLNQHLAANVWGKKLAGDPPQFFQVLENLIKTDGHPGAVASWQVLGWVLSEITSFASNSIALNQLGYSFSEILEFEKIYAETEYKTIVKMIETYAGKVGLTFKDLLNNLGNVDAGIGYERRRTLFARHSLIRELQKLHQQQEVGTSEEGEKGENGREVTPMNITDLLDQMLIQDAVIVDLKGIAHKLFDRVFGFTKRFIKHNESEIKSFEDLLKIVKESRIELGEIALGAIQDMDEGNILVRIEGLMDKFGLNSKNHKSLDTLKDILEGNDEIILELGKLLSDMSSSSGAAQLDELIRDYYKQFSADLSSGHSHHEEGGDVTEEMDHARVTHSDFFENLGKINISSESLKNEEVAEILKIWLGETDSTFENLISKLQRVDPQDAIRILTDATKAAGGPANGGDLSHKTKEVIGALFTQIPAVASIVHLVKKVIDPIEDSLLKRNAILGVSGIMSGIADNVAAYLFALAMLKDMYRQSYGPDIFEKVPQLIIAVDNAAMNVAEDQGGLSKVGNAPAIGQEVPKGEFMTEVNGLFRKVKVNLVPYTLGKSMIKNGYGHANFLFSLLASNSFISAGEYFLNKYLDLNLPK